MLEIFIYLIVFIIGTLFGSFFSLAIYRLPIKQSIMHGRSYCPKCNHKLGFFDLIPILSYICLGAKCRYCKEKIRGRYIYLEVLSGIAFLLFALSLKINIFNLEVAKIVYLIFGFLYLSTLFIIGGIDKETHTISKPVLLFGLIVEAIYMIYLYIIGTSIYRYVIYLFLIIIFILIYGFILKKKSKYNYALQLLILCFFCAILATEEAVILSIIITLIFVAIKEILINKNNNKSKIAQKDITSKIPIAFYLCYSNIIIMILQNFIIN